MVKYEIISNLKTILKPMAGTIVGIFITFCWHPLIFLDIILIPLLLIEIIFLIIGIAAPPIRAFFDFLSPTKYSYDSDTETSYDDNIYNNKEIPITGDHFFPRKDGACVHQCSKVCETCARRKKEFGNYTMGYHCYM